MTYSLDQLDRDGYLALGPRVNEATCAALKEEIFDWHRRQSALRPSISAHHWGVHHFVEYPHTQALLTSDWLHDFCDALFHNQPWILHAIGASINPPAGQGAYAHGSQWHRDSPTYRAAGREYIIVMLFLDDFTIANGCTEVAPGTHLQEAVPAVEELMRHTVHATAPRGSALAFFPDTVHRAGTNTTDQFRVGITMAITRPYLKPLMDYARLLGLDQEAHLSQRLAQVLGYNAKVPQSMTEWNAPPEQRFYKRGQG